MGSVLWKGMHYVLLCSFYALIIFINKWNSLPALQCTLAVINLRICVFWFFINLCQSPFFEKECNLSTFGLSIAPRLIFTCSSAVNIDLMAMMMRKDHIKEKIFPLTLQYFFSPFHLSIFLESIHLSRSLCKCTVQRRV